MKTYYSRNPLIWHRCKWTGVGLLNIMDYFTLPILTKFVTESFLLLHSRTSEYVHVSVIFILLLKVYAFLTFLGQSWIFLRTHFCKPFLQHLFHLPIYQDFHCISIQIRYSLWDCEISPVETSVRKTSVYS